MCIMGNIHGTNKFVSIKESQSMIDLKCVGALVELHVIALLSSTFQLTMLVTNLSK